MLKSSSSGHHPAVHQFHTSWPLRYKNLSSSFWNKQNQPISPVRNTADRTNPHTSSKIIQHLFRITKSRVGHDGNAQHCLWCAELSGFPGFQESGSQKLDICCAETTKSGPIQRRSSRDPHAHRRQAGRHQLPPSSAASQSPAAPPSGPRPPASWGPDPAANASQAGSRGLAGRRRGQARRGARTCHLSPAPAASQPSPSPSPGAHSPASWEPNSASYASPMNHPHNTLVFVYS
jgi:hypothetical protein